MKTIALALSAGSATAASYLDGSGTVHDPLLHWDGVVYTNHPYSGNDLKRGANLSGTKLTGAYLHRSYLSETNLTGADLSDAYLKDANLYRSNLTGVNLTSAYMYDLYTFTTELHGANLTNGYLRNVPLPYSGLSEVILFSADLAGARYWETATWTGAKYSLNAVDNSGNPIPDTTFPDGMDQAWRDAAGMVAVPEPATALILGLGLVGLAAHRRRLG